MYNKDVKSYGLVIEPLAPEDYVFGSSQSLGAKFGAEVLQPNSDWREFLPETERQAPGYETNACVSFSIANCIETLARRVHKQTRNFSDRFIAKGSGTNPAVGNSHKRVADFVYRNFTCYESEWATKDALTANEFYAEIPESLKLLAKARGSEYDFGYEFVSTSIPALKEALKYSPLGISVPAWFEKDGEYYRPEGTRDNHAVELVAIEDETLIINDTYAPFIKRVNVIPTVAMAFYLKRNVVKKNAFRRFIELIKSIIYGME